MKCFTHPQSDAVGACKNCFKGVCPQCAKESEAGIVCSPVCESEAKSIRAMLERNKKMVVFAPKTHSRSAIWLTLMALLFFGFGVQEHYAPFPIGMGLILLLGALFSYVNGRKIARMAADDKA